MSKHRQDEFLLSEVVKKEHYFSYRNNVPFVAYMHVQMDAMTVSVELYICRLVQPYMNKYNMYAHIPPL